MFCHLLLCSLTGAQQQLHNSVIPAQPTIPHPALPLWMRAAVPSFGIRHQPDRLTAWSVKKKPLPWQLLPALSPSLSQIPGEKPNKAAVMSCQDFNEQFPQTPSCAETRPSRCTVSSVCCSLVQTAAGTAILPLNHHSSGEVALFGKGNRRGERFARDVYTVLLRG